MHLRWLLVQETEKRYFLQEIISWICFQDIFVQETEKRDLPADLPNSPSNDKVSCFLCRRFAGVADQPGRSWDLSPCSVRYHDYMYRERTTPTIPHQYQVYQPLGDSFLAALVSWNPLKHLRCKLLSELSQELFIRRFHLTSGHQLSLLAANILIQAKI